MKRIYFALLAAVVFTLGCSNGSDENSGGEKDPSTVQPPSEAIPDSTKLVNDSVVVPDVTPGNGRQVGNSDSIQKNKH